MHILRPSRELILPFRFGMCGFYRLRAFRPDGRMRVDTGWFPNIITDWGLNARGATGGVLDYAHVGSGSTAPAATDTTLETWVASSNTTQSDTGGTQTSTTPYYVWNTVTKRFGEGAAEGNISEVGMAPTAGSTDPLFSRALVLDAGGSPTTITVLADEILDVSYELRHYPPTADGSFSVADGGTTYNVTTRASHVGNWGNGSLMDDKFDNNKHQNSQGAYDGGIGTVLEAPSGNSDSASSSTSPAYLNNSLKQEYTVIWDLNDANFANKIKSVQIHCGIWSQGGIYQAEFDPVIDKDSTKRLTIGMEIGWGRASI